MGRVNDEAEKVNRRSTSTSPLNYMVQASALPGGRSMSTISSTCVPYT